MALTLSDLTVDISGFEQFSLLSDWTWLIGATRVPILVTAAGDAFLEDAGHGSITFLDSQGGEITPVAANVDDLRRLLGEPDFVSDHLSVDMIGDLKSRGATLGTGQVFDLTTPLVLGGDFALENIAPVDADVHFSLLGQIHRQVNELQEGSSIRSVSSD